MSDLRLGVFPKMAPIIPPGARGNAAIDHFTITPDTWQGFHGEHIRPGVYARLKVNGGTMMSDTDMELRTNYRAVQKAKGDVLIGGLGLGAILLPMLRKSTVSSVTVVEVNPNVIALVEAPLRRAAGADGTKLRIVKGDVKTWRPATFGRQFDFIYFDIWPNLCTDQVDEMKALHLAFRRYLRPGGSVTSWEYDRLKYLRSQGRWR